MSSRGPKPKPIELKKIQGNPGHRPLNLSQPKPKVPVKRPRGMGGLQKKFWNEYAPELERLQILTGVDSAAFRLMADHFAIAVQAVRELGYSKEKALEQIGENDPQAIFDDAFEEKYEEMLEAAELSLEGQRYQMLGMAEQAGLGLLAQMLNSGDPMIMQALQQLQQQVIQAQQQQAQQQQTQGGNGRRPQGQEQPPNPANEGLGVEGVGGQGYNPAVGGTPPSEAAPGATAEGQRGRGRGE